MNLLRWLRTWPAAVLWAFVLAGCVGMFEGLYMWVRYGSAAAAQDGHGFVAAMAPYVTLYGWGGAMIAAAAFPIAAFFTQRASRPRHDAFVLAVAAALGALVAVYCAYLFRAHLMPGWWGDHVDGQGRILLAVIWGVSLALLRVPGRRVAGFLVRSPGKGVIFPLALMIVSSALLPNWREEGAILRTAHLGPQPEAVAAGAGRPDIVLISIDTWRPDMLSSRNPASPPTPALDALAAEGIDYRNVWSPSCWTMPGMAALMTGWPPRALGIGRRTPMPQTVPTLPEMAWRNGYRTAAFICNPYLSPGNGFDRGFVDFDHAMFVDPLEPAKDSILAREIAVYTMRRLQPDDASTIFGKAIRWVRRRPQERPWLLWIHLMNPHLPYQWRDMPGFADPTPAAGVEPDPSRIPDRPEFAGRRFEVLEDMDELRAAGGVEDWMWEGMRTLYAREVQYTDAWVGRFLAALREEGVYDDALLVVVADHGEEFNDHGGYEHGHSLMPEVSSVPLLVRLPGGDGGGVIRTDPVSTLDLLPSLCAEMGWETEGLPGRSDLWAPAGDAAEPRTARVQRLENMLYGPERTALMAWPWFRVETPGEGPPRWFDMRSDPLLKTPAAAPASAAGIEAAGDSLRAAWDAVAAAWDRSGGDAPREVDAATEARLRSLGY